MAGPVSIKVVGVNIARLFIIKQNRKATRTMDKALAKASIFMMGEVKLSIAGERAEPMSVDTGRFLNTVSIKKVSKEEAIVFSALPYAPFLEFGRGGFRGRRHFENSKNRNKQKIESIFNKEFFKEFVKPI